MPEYDLALRAGSDRVLRRADLFQRENLGDRDVQQAMRSGVQRGRVGPVIEFVDDHAAIGIGSLGYGHDAEGGIRRLACAAFRAWACLARATGYWTSASIGPRDRPTWSSAQAPPPWTAR